jgi:hypothetical protein
MLRDKVTDVLNGGAFGNIPDAPGQVICLHDRVRP